ncbi:hypothetical protein [Spirillospora sp. CA-294931]|uniref:hypothetical protein n=1 Tax=Spirillospora sp. CA-294931 TaxID=3240042 RepID=UPI003D90161D
MKITRVKALVAGCVVLLVLGIGAGVAYAALVDTKELRYKTQAALRTALPGLASHELRARGVALKAAPVCADIAGWTKERMRASCTATTASGDPVKVIATGDDATRHHSYTVLVDGRPVIENARCLGPDCQKKS